MIAATKGRMMEATARGVEWLRLLKCRNHTANAIRKIPASIFFISYTIPFHGIPCHNL